MNPSQSRGAGWRLSRATVAANNVTFRRHRFVVAAVVAALALASPGLAAAQAIPCTLAAPIPPRQFQPGNTGDAFLLDKKGAFSTFAVPGDVIETLFSDLNNRGYHRSLRPLRPDGPGISAGRRRPDPD
jgi:hypothetical protein